MNNFLFTFLVYIAFGVSFFSSSSSFLSFLSFFCWLKNFESNIMLRPALPHQIRSLNIYKHFSTVFPIAHTEKKSISNKNLKDFREKIVGRRWSLLDLFLFCFRYEIFLELFSRFVFSSFFKQYTNFQFFLIFFK